jgi:hypothetical protein
MIAGAVVTLKLCANYSLFVMATKQRPVNGNPAAGHSRHCGEERRGRGGFAQ